MDEFLHSSNRKIEERERGREREIDNDTFLLLKAKKLDQERKIGKIELETDLVNTSI